jgi:hypothetical protein
MLIEVATEVKVWPLRVWPLRVVGQFDPSQRSYRNANFPGTRARSACRPSKLLPSSPSLAWNFGLPLGGC